MNNRGAPISVTENFQNYKSKNIQNYQVSEVCPSLNDVYQHSEGFATINSLLIRKSHQQPINKTLATKKIKKLPNRRCSKL